MASRLSKVWICLFMVTLSLTGSIIAYASSSSESKSESETQSSSSESESEAESESPAASKEFVVTLNHSNFTEFVSTHKFVVVEFYAPWCGACKKLAPEYEKAASILSKDDPSIVLAKVDANEETNKDLAAGYGLRGYPTIKILKFGGGVVQDYKGPHDADGIIAYLKKQTGPASVQIKSLEDATTRIDNVKKIVIVGVFPEFSGEKFENFKTLAEKLRADYDFGHTTDAKLLPRGDSSATGPMVRLFKPFDELFVDFEEFDVDVLEKLVEKASTPLITLFNKDVDNRQFVIKFFESPNAKAMLFINYTSENIEAFKSKYREVAEEFKGQEIIFSIGDAEASQAVFEHFGVKEKQVPFIIVQTGDGQQKYLKPNVESHQISSWLKDFKDGKLRSHKKSEPVPEVNDEPVKVVVADSLEDVVFNSGKNVLLEFYAPWCGHCKNLAPILDEIAISFQNDADVVIAKIDATANDYSHETFDVKGYPSLYFQSASGKLLQYDGDRTKDDIISFIKKNRGNVAKKYSGKDEL